MTDPGDERRTTVVGAVLMTLVLVWSGALAAGFAWAAVDGSGMGTSRRLLFSLIAAFLGLLAGRTGYELVRRLRHR